MGAIVSHPHLWSLYVTIASVEPIAKARDRLLQRTARALGLGGTAIAALCLSIPGVLPADTYLVVLPLLVLMAFSQFQVGRNRSIVWVLLGLHTTHILTDFLDSAVLTVLMFTGPLEERRFVDVSENAMYWYFVVLSWLPIYALIYFAPRLA